MKKKILSLFFILVFFASCKQEVGHYDYVESKNSLKQEEMQQRIFSDVEKREMYLRSLMDVQCYTVEDEKIERDLQELLQSIKANEGEQCSVLTLQKKDSNLFDMSEIALFSSDEKGIEKSINLSLYKIENGDKTGFAITCNDLRIGEILAIVEDGEFDTENDPFIKLFLANIKEYVYSTLNTWHKLKAESEITGKSQWRDLVESNEYLYSNWKINTKNFKKFLLNTQWDQSEPYNNVIKKLKHPEAPAGCVTVAIAQIMAYHRFPVVFYNNNGLFHFMFKKLLEAYFPIAKSWDGKYNWRFLTKKQKVEELHSEKYNFQVASLMYEIATTCNATYSKEGTGITTENCIKCLFFHDYLTGVCTRTPVSPPQEVPIRLVPFSMKDVDNSFSETSSEEMLESDFSVYSVSDTSPYYYKPDGSGHKIRYTDYSFDAIKNSIDCLAPVLIEGRGIEKDEGKSLSNGGKNRDFGHAWVIDGYCNLTCDAVNRKTLEHKTITADYVHCNLGWGGLMNGYYISNVFTFGFKRATATDENICPKGKADGHVKYEIKIFPNLIPKSKLGESRDAFVGYRYNWRPL